MNVDVCLQLLLSNQCLPEKWVGQLCEAVKEILVEESTVQPVHAPVNVCGCIYGQFLDLLKLFSIGGEGSRYIFNGGYVDRGYRMLAMNSLHSVETLEYRATHQCSLYLLCMKLKYPQEIVLLRGFHESRAMSSQYGFYKEIMQKYGNANPWKIFTDLFDYLPLGAIVDEQIFCVSGGLSPEMNTVDELRTIDRVQEVPTEGPLCDLLWSDPNEQEESWALSYCGAGYTFGSKVVEDFHHINGTELIVHSRLFPINLKGYKEWFQNRMVTVWSSTNLRGLKNQGVTLRIDGNLERHIEEIYEVPMTEELSETAYQQFPLH